MKFILFIALLISVIFIETIMLIDYEANTKRHIDDIEKRFNTALQDFSIQIECPETATSSYVLSTTTEESVKPE